MITLAALLTLAAVAWAFLVLLALLVIEHRMSRIQRALQRIAERD